MTAFFNVVGLPAVVLGPLFVVALLSSKFTSANHAITALIGAFNRDADVNDAAASAETADDWDRADRWWEK